MSNIATAEFVIVFLIFLRILAVFLASPIFSNQAIPVLAKVFLSMVISYIVYLTVDFPDMHLRTDIISIALYGTKEMITGLTIGFALNFVFYAVSSAGVLIGFDMGLAMATVFNPMEESNDNIISQSLYFLAMLVFLMINGHHYIITSVVSSFKVIPLGKFTINLPVYTMLVKYSAAVFVIAVKIAAPIMVSFFLIHIGEGIIARVIPQMNVFFVAQPLTIGLGFFLLILVIPIYTYFFKYLLQGFESNLLQLIKLMGA